MNSELETVDYTIIPEHVFRANILPYFHKRFKVIAKKYANRKGKFHYKVTYEHYDGWKIRFDVMRVKDRQYLQRVYCYYYGNDVSWGRGSWYGQMGNYPLPNKLLEPLKFLWETLSQRIDEFDPERATEWLDIGMLKPFTICIPERIIQLENLLLKIRQERRLRGFE